MSTRRLGLIIGPVMLCMVFFVTLTGCVGYAGPDYDDDDGGVYMGPPVVGMDFFGGDYDRPYDVHAYSHRGFESRSFAHHWGGHGGGFRGGGHDEHRR
ncbi:MAG TPA: hypothetical protein VGY56_00915 [Verrucomicrobiae bacterium]|nr:hypothetical protein [Verrucomicrobiae bacterium]